jgi:hypothetical protein
MVGHTSQHGSVTDRPLTHFPPPPAQQTHPRIGPTTDAARPHRTDATPTPDPTRHQARGPRRPQTQFASQPGAMIKHVTRTSTDRSGQSRRSPR